MRARASAASTPFAASAELAAPAPSAATQMLSRLLPPGAGTAPRPARSAPQRLARAPRAARPSTAPPVRTLARAAPGADAAADAAGGGGGGGAAAHPSGGGGGGGGHNSDENFNELLRRVREEQEQLGQLINHPF
jgi:hypothetical protein